MYATLKECKVSDLQNETKDVIVLHNNTDPAEAIGILTKNNIRAAPVKDTDDSFMGVLDIRDTVHYTLQCLQSNAPKNAAPVLSQTFGLRTFAFKTVHTFDSLLAVLGYLADGAHIVGIVNEEEDALIGIINQSKLFEFVANKWKSIENDCLLQQMFDCKYITSPIEYVRYDMSAYDAFDAMSKKKKSGLAVVDADGVLLHNTSATDLKLWRAGKDEKDYNLDQPIDEFLIKIRRKSTEKTRHPTCSCTLDMTLHTAIKRLAATKYHRLWIVDENKRPIGVLSLTDIFEFLPQRTRMSSINNYQ